MLCELPFSSIARLQLHESRAQEHKQKAKEAQEQQQTVIAR
jgi:hypothetical protein